MDEEVIFEQEKEVEFDIPLYKYHKMRLDSFCVEEKQKTDLSFDYHNALKFNITVFEF